MAVEVFMPKMSDHMESGEIVQWLVGEGDSVKEGQAIIEVITDKVTTELEAPASGRLKGIRKGAEKGAHVPVGETIAFVAGDDEDVPDLPPLVQVEGPGEQSESGSTAVPWTETIPAADKAAQNQRTGVGRVAQGLVKASPAARRRARELGIEISHIRGAGPGEMVRESDVVTFHKQSLTVSGPDKTGGAELLKPTPFQKATGDLMVLSASTAPQFFLSVSAEVEKLLSLRDLLMKRVEAGSGRRLSITTLLIKIAAAALSRYPRANTSFEKGMIRQYRDVNIGVAVGTDEGLVAPVIKKADQKSISQINLEMKTFEEKVHSMKFDAGDLAGGHFTISNLGMYGIDRFNAIVNPPQSSILAVGRIINTPVGTEKGSIVLKKLMDITLSVDHRCMDGVQGARFLTIIKQLIETPDIFKNGGENAA